MNIAQAFQAASVNSLGVSFENSMAYTRVSVAGPFICAMKFESDGWVTSQSDSNPGPHGIYRDDYKWLTRPGTVNSDYEVMVSQTSGDTLDGGSSALDTWLALSTDRIYALTAATDKTSKSASLSFQIRAAGTGAVIHTGTFTLYSENN